MARVQGGDRAVLQAFAAPLEHMKKREKGLGRRIAIVSGVCAATCLGAGALWWKDFAVSHYLSRLRREPEFFVTSLRGDPDSLQRLALTDYLNTSDGREAFLSFFLAEFKRDYADHNPPGELRDVDKGVIALLVSYKSTWRFWELLMWASGARISGGNSESHSAYLDEIAELLPLIANHPITLPDYPGLEFTVLPYERAQSLWREEWGMNRRNPRIHDFVCFVSSWRSGFLLDERGVDCPPPGERVP